VKAAAFQKLEAAWTAEAEDFVLHVAVSPDAARVAAVSAEGPALLLDASSGAVIRRLRAHGLGTLYAAWQPAGALLATCGQDSKVRLWDGAADKAVAELPGPSNEVARVAWSPDGRFLAATHGKSARIWRADGTLALEVPALPHTLAAAAWSPDGARLAIAAYGGVQLVDPVNGSVLAEKGWGGALECLAWSPDGAILAGGGRDGAVLLWNPRLDADMQAGPFPGPVKSLHWDASGRFLVTSGAQECVVWDLKDRRLKGGKARVLEMHAATVEAVAFAPGGERVASGAGDGVVFVWITEGSKRPVASATREGAVTSIAWCGGDRSLVAGYADGTVARWG